MPLSGTLCNMPRVDHTLGFARPEGHGNGSTFDTNPAPSGASPLTDRPHGHFAQPGKTSSKYTSLSLP